MEKVESQTTWLTVFELNGKAFCNIKVSDGMITEASNNGLTTGVHKIITKERPEPFIVYPLDAEERALIGHLANCKLKMKEYANRQFLYLNLSDAVKEQLN